MRNLVAVAGIILVLTHHGPLAQAQQVNTEEALLWPQFVVGPAGDTSFDVELTISNIDSNNDWEGDILMATQEYTPIEGVEVAFADDVEVSSSSGGEWSDARPLFTKGRHLKLGPRQTARVLLRATAQLQVAVIGFLILNPVDGLASQLVTTFAYNLRNSSGKIVDHIPVPPTQAGLLFFTTLYRAAGLNTGLAIVALTSALVQILVYDSVLSPSGERSLLAESEQFFVYGQQAFFPHEKIAGLSQEIPGALVEIRSVAGVPIWVTALDVAAPPAATQVQIAAKEVKNVPVQLASVAAALQSETPR